MNSSFNLLPRPERSALVVIDIQERLAAVMQAEEIEGVIRSSVILIETAKEFGLPVVVSEQYPKGLGPTMPQICAVLPETTKPVQKLSFSCCGEPGLQTAFERLGECDLILCGIETHVCVLQTAVDLLRQGRRVFVAGDAVCSRSALNRQLGLELMRQAGAVIGSAEIFAFGMLGAAGSERFKRISRLVK
jgi:nicotinamidase-related amidase